MQIQLPKITPRTVLVSTTQYFPKRRYSFLFIRCVGGFTLQGTNLQVPKCVAGQSRKVYKNNYECKQGRSPIDSSCSTSFHQWSNQRVVAKLIKMAAQTRLGSKQSFVNQSG